MTLKEVCAVTGASRRAIQGYEKARLVSPSGKNKMGHLLYNDDTVQRIKQIKFYQDVGFAVKDIEVLLSENPSILKKRLEEQLIVMKKDLCEKEILIQKVERLISSL